MITALEGGGSASRPGRSLSPGKTRYPLYRRLGVTHSRSGQVRKILPPTGIRFPDRPAPCQSLYRLSYPAYTEYRQLAYWTVSVTRHFTKHSTCLFSSVRTVPISISGRTDPYETLFRPYKGVPATKIRFALTACRVRCPQPPLSSGGGPNCAEQSQPRHGLHFLLSLLSSSNAL